MSKQMINELKAKINIIIEIIKDNKNLQKAIFFVLWFILMLPAFYHCYIIKINNPMIIKRIFEFYPLLFLPLFIKRIKFEFKTIDLIVILILVVGYFYGRFLNYLYVYSIFQIFIGLYLLRFVGINIHLFGFLLFIMVPQFTDKYTLIFGFQLRLFLTKFVGAFLSLIGRGVEVSGNVVCLNGRMFAVDLPCDGLNMFIAMGLLMLILSYRALNNNFIRKRRVFFIIALCTLSFCLWLISNLTRIILLIIWNIQAGSFLHELVGVFLFVGIVVIPVVFLSIFMFKGSIKKIKKEFSYDSKGIIIAFLILFLFLSISYMLPDNDKELAIKWPYKIAGFYLDEKYKDNEKYSDIASYNGANSLLIIKRNLTPFRILHHPRQCWVGSGYKFKNEEIIYINNFGKVNMVTLEKDGKEYKLYWWYQRVEDYNSLKKKAIANEIKYRFNSFFSKDKFVQINLFFYESDYSVEVFNELKRVEVWGKLN